jgi:hypothetical protein
LALVQAGTRPEDLKWLEAKATEPGVIATGTGLLYKGEFSIFLSCSSCCLLAGRICAYRFSPYLSYYCHACMLLF